MSDALALPEDSINKKKMIARLLSEGTYSTKDIVRIARTTEGYVSKEKSKLRKAGILVQRDTQVISKTSRFSIVDNSSLINVPKAVTESLRKLYGELLGGKKPQQIIAEHGFHSVTNSKRLFRERKPKVSKTCRK